MFSFFCGFFIYYSAGPQKEFKIQNFFTPKLKKRNLFPLYTEIRLLSTKFYKKLSIFNVFSSANCLPEHGWKRCFVVKIKTRQKLKKVFHFWHNNDSLIHFNFICVHLKIFLDTVLLSSVRKCESCSFMLGHVLRAI